MSVRSPRLPSATKKPRKTKPVIDKWASASVGRKFIERKVKGHVLLPEPVVEAFGKGVDQAHAVWLPTTLMFKLFDALAQLSDITSVDLREPTYPQEDEVLSMLDELGMKSLRFVRQCERLIAEVRALEAKRQEMKAFFDENAELLKLRRQLVSEQQMVAAYVTRIEKKLQLGKKLTPMDLETIVQLSAIHEGHDLDKSKETLQQMAGRWRTIRKKVRKTLVPKLEAAARSRAAKKRP
jgi:hypothetical protein